ncbi:fructosamine kinase family protein [Brevibacterium linens]|uniref:Fructosamine-3-kinase n=1 Tax=Brevibacterium linens ATCC 9172 TaxID=1255617 RepID=A0A2H1JJR2_BRELN|nr:fructosamine kinase family protein [Brevibacterium linens]AZU00342.1 fructosamine kinase [Brevibacterium linens]KAB1947358.1 phosphotransferase [Brevibacterium linens ATCC 9172]SMX87631.1 Fructosamine-3-kinase [Brevibacterium linens ATCC 9172]
MTDFLKLRKSAPDGFFAAEAAGLKWLAEPGVVPVVEVLEHGPDFLRLRRLEETGPDAEAAAAFGRDLARLHDAGAPGFGWSPAPQAFFGPLDHPFEVPAESVGDFTGYWAEQRLRPLVTAVAGDLEGEDRAMIASAIDTIASGAFAGICGEGEEAPARIHGDLWAGNLMWTPTGVTLIDPAAHGGHRLEDLALLALFGTPFLEEIFSGYERAHPMPDGWQEDLPAHSFFALLAHIRLFGRGFLGQTVRAARSVIARAAQLDR